MDSQVGRMMHDEHVATLAVMNRLEAACRARRAPDASDAAFSSLISDLRAKLQEDLQRHFAFEESLLFPLLDDAGEGDIAAVLGEEHDAIRDVATSLLALLDAAAGADWDDASWADFRRQAGELAERQIAHVQKEELGLLPVLPDLLEPDQDADMAMSYLSA